MPTGDPEATRFAQVTAQMAALAGLPAEESQQDAYPRYQQWLAFVGSVDAFTATVRADLGQDPLAGESYSLAANGSTA